MCYKILFFKTWVPRHLGNLICEGRLSPQLRCARGAAHAEEPARGQTAQVLKGSEISGFKVRRFMLFSTTLTTTQASRGHPRCSSVYRLADERIATLPIAVPCGNPSRPVLERNCSVAQA